MTDTEEKIFTKNEIKVCLGGFLKIEAKGVIGTIAAFCLGVTAICVIFWP
jgi:hypothetical protein